jgi:hypothetical protein
LGLHSASFPLILYHEQVKLQCFSFLLKLSSDVLLYFRVGQAQW